MAASSVWTPMGRPSPESRAEPGSLRRSARPAPGELPRGRGRRARGRVRDRRRAPVRPGPVELPAGRCRAWLRHPDRRTARHAVRYRPRRIGHRATGEPRRRRADGPFPALRGGAVRSADREGDRRGEADGADQVGRRAGDTHRTGRTSRTPRPAANPSSNPRLPGAPNRGQRGARRPRGGACRRRRAASAGRPTGLLSYHSLEDRIVKRFLDAERRGCVCPPELPVCVCGRQPRLRLVTRPSLTPTEAEIARQSTRAKRPTPGRRASRRLTIRNPRKEDRVSHRHQANRRRAYGRRQHELHERVARSHATRSPRARRADRDRARRGLPVVLASGRRIA